MTPAAQSEHRYRAALPTSSMVTCRRKGAIFLKAEYILLKPATPAADRVRIGPAEMALTRMCFSWLPRSTAR